MAITQAPILKFAFAENGDRKDIAIDADPKGEMSWEQGYSLAYSQDPAKDGKYILREHFNQVLFNISQGVKDLQINGGRVWDTGSANVIGGFPAGARVLVRYDLSTNQIVEADLPSSVEGLLMSSTRQLVSMRDNNIISPFTENALFKDWWLDDGVDMFGLKITTQNPTADYFKIPAGYLDLGGNPATEYPYELYPRVKYFKDKGAMPTYFTDGGTFFKIVDVRGRFPRIFSNGGSIDSGRQFGTLQGDAIRNITGRAGTSVVLNIAEGCFHKENVSNDNPNPQTRSGTRDLHFRPGNVVPVTDIKKGENRPNNLNFKWWVKV